MDNDQLYEAHDAEGEGGGGGGERAELGRGGSGPTATTDTHGGVASEVGVSHGENINRFRNRVMAPAESASDLDEKVSTKMYY